MAENDGPSPGPDALAGDVGTGDVAVVPDGSAGDAFADGDADAMVFDGSDLLADAAPELGVDWGAPPDGGYTSLDLLVKLKEAPLTCDPGNTAGGLAPAGVCTLVATVTNTSSQQLRPVRFRVTTLTGGNLLLNADGGAGGAGSTLSVSPGQLGPAGLLGLGASFKQTFEIGLQTSNQFDFYVSLEGQAL